MSTLQLLLELRARKLANAMTESDPTTILGLQNSSYLPPVQLSVRKPEDRNDTNMMFNIVTARTPNDLTRAKVPIANCKLAASYAPDRTKRNTYNVEARAKDTCNELHDNNLCDKSNSRWYEFYSALKEFQNTNGHCIVPSNYEARKLAYWVSRSRNVRLV